MKDSMKYLIIDPVCPKPYTLDTLSKEAMGGTEATVLRICHALASKGNYVTLSQRGREADEQDLKGNLNYSTLEQSNPREWDVIIVLRDAGVYKQAVQDNPLSKHYLWLHDVVSGQYTDHLAMHLTGMDANIVCVSRWHLDHTKLSLASAMHLNRLNFAFAYNPLAVYCTKTTSDYDKYKLVFFSSPHKGLNEVLSIFNELVTIDSNYKLYIANPGYYASSATKSDSIINLGSLPHAEIMEHVRGALCTFYPQTGFEETFGLVLAESNAVGTPVISHHIGAASEILDHPKQLMNCNNKAEVIKRILSWSAGARPIVSGNKSFNINSVIAKWEA